MVQVLGDPEPPTDPERRRQNECEPSLVLITRRVAHRYIDHSMTVYAAAISFWAVISLVPLLAMVVFGVAIFAEPGSIDTFLDEVSSAVPGETAEMLTEQARTWSSASARWSTVWLVVAALVASWGASAGVSQLIRAINAAHERPRRSFAVRRLSALARTITALVIIVPVVILIGATPTALEANDADPSFSLVILSARWPVALLLFTLLLSGLYWIARNDRRSFRLVTPGVVVAGSMFLVGSIGFSLYASNVDRYDQSYGSLATVVVTMLWVYVSTSAVLLGAEVDAEHEGRQRARGAGSDR